MFLISVCVELDWNVFEIGSSLYANLVNMNSRQLINISGSVTMQIVFANQYHFGVNIVSFVHSLFLRNGLTDAILFKFTLFLSF